MKRRRLPALLCAMLLLFGCLAACGQSAETREGQETSGETDTGLIGFWTEAGVAESPRTISFGTNGKGQFNMYGDDVIFSYSADGGTLRAHLTGDAYGEEGLDTQWTYTLDSDTELTVTYGPSTVVTYTKNE